MRQLTLNEKITIKGKLAQKGLCIPKLTIEDAVYFWNKLYGNPIIHCFTEKMFYTTMKRI